MRSLARRTGVVALALGLACVVGCRPNEVPRGPKVDPQVLAQYEVRPEALPKPFATADSSNPPQIVPPPPGAKLVMPPGFQIDTYAAGDFVNPRWVVQ